MITKINKIKDFGIFQNFAWDGLDSFTKKNLIYGWNYSGKTTLSKLFQNLEFKDKNKYFSGSEFDFTTEKNNTATHHTQNDLVSFPYAVKVFNTNYLKRIFTFDEPNSGIQPISFYLGDPSGELDKKIKNLDKKKVQLENIRDNRYQKIVDEFNNYNKTSGKFSVKAKDIRENYLDNKLDQNKLNKGVIQQIADTIKADLTTYILSATERDKTKAEAIAENTFDTQKEDYGFTENLETLAEEVKGILEDTAPKSIPFPELDENSALFDWVQKGIKLHEGETECKFCTKTLPENRISDLNSYYSKKLKEIQDAVAKTQEKIKSEKEKLKITFPDKKNLGNGFQSDYQNAVDNYDETVKKYKTQLSILEYDLKRKTSDYFNNIPSTEIELITFEEDCKEIKEAVKAHNDWLAEFDENKKKSLAKILNHYVAEYLQAEDYNKKEADKNQAVTIISNINSKIATNKTDKLALEAQLKSSVKGQSELNDILEILLHRDDIKIEIRNDKFTLERSGHPASNLSEGEKSAIAFAYFLTELKALRNDDPPKLPNTIVFIDDPISSLDSNHIFQVRLLLHNFFKVTDFAQLFISTHNFEFFSVMLDTRLFGTIKRDTNENKRPLYFIKRNDNNTALIKKLPSSFSSYKSEYVGLFHTIKEFNDLESKEDFPNLLILPNAVRRFLELYTLMKYPSDSEVDNRVKRVFNPEDKPTYNTKLLHWFSHQNQFEKVQQHDDKILQVEDVIKELLEHIKTKDELHWKGLIGD
jgi:wobble nucleotide-excising tRNase